MAPCERSVKIFISTAFYISTHFTINNANSFQVIEMITYNENLPWAVQWEKVAHEIEEATLKSARPLQPLTLVLQLHGLQEQLPWELLAGKIAKLITRTQLQVTGFNMNTGLLQEVLCLWVLNFTILIHSSLLIFSLKKIRVKLTLRIPACPLIHLRASYFFILQHTQTTSNPFFFKIQWKKQTKNLYYYIFFLFIWFGYLPLILFIRDQFAGPTL